MREQDRALPVARARRELGVVGDERHAATGVEQGHHLGRRPADESFESVARLLTGRAQADLDLGVVLALDLPHEQRTACAGTRASRCA